jgi:hypothetical protein
MTLELPEIDRPESAAARAVSDIHVNILPELLNCNYIIVLLGSFYNI